MPKLYQYVVRSEGLHEPVPLWTSMSLRMHCCTRASMYTGSNQSICMVKADSEVTHVSNTKSIKCSDDTYAVAGHVQSIIPSDVLSKSIP
ncbi:hypothetical protein KC347_g176 [Hortaea werneckii]|nr:hypothetical protein KC347_g176 [Hortaea werneckii]